MQHTKTLEYFYKNYPESEIIVSMSEPFCNQIANQYENIRGRPKHVIFIKNAIKDLSSQKKEENNQVISTLELI